jgi:SAM-dependent methyltransferase
LTHYSYTFYRDPHHAHQYEGDRFGGPVGGWLLGLEIETYLQMVRPRPGERILDVGTGTGKLLAPMASAGAQVVAVDASPAMLQQAAAKAGSAAPAGRVGLAVMDGHRLGFADRSFDAVLSSRVLMHVVDPDRFVAELCRVSRDRVVLDFPPLSSSNALRPLLLPLKRLVDPQTHPFRVYPVRRIVRAFRREGFEVRQVHRALALPHFVHRRLGRPQWSARIEGVLRALGLTRLLGAPVTVEAVRR